MKALSKPAAAVFRKLTEGLAVGSSRRVDNAPGAFMYVSVERLSDDTYSIAHYYEQEGDLMADPDVMFYVAGGDVYPVEITQAGLGVYRRYVEFEGGVPARINARGQADLTSFANTWMKNIQAQQFRRGTRMRVGAARLRATAPLSPDAEAVRAWLKRHHLFHSMTFYTRDEWLARGEPHGNNALFTITAEGPFYHLMNYPESRAQFRLIDDFNLLLKKRGLYYEQGFAWSFHFYPRGGLPKFDAERDQIAKRANDLADELERGGGSRGYPKLAWNSDPDTLIRWMSVLDPNSTWDTAYEDEEVSESDLWDGIDQYLKDT